jgi:hypothetical protein
VTIYDFGNELKGYQICEIKEQSYTEWFKSFVSIDTIDYAISLGAFLSTFVSVGFKLEEGWATKNDTKENIMAKYAAYGKAVFLLALTYLTWPFKTENKEAYHDQSLSFMLANNNLQWLKKKQTEEDKYEKMLHLVQYPGKCREDDTEVYQSLLGEWKICEVNLYDL